MIKSLQNLSTEEILLQKAEEEKQKFKQQHERWQLFYEKIKSNFGRIYP